MLLRLRITLPDRPGSLARITRVLGVAGADITQFVVLDRGDGRARRRHHRLLAGRRSREAIPGPGLESVSGVIVEGIWSTREAPGTYPELEILKYITTAGDRALATLIDSMPVLFSADWAAAATEKAPRTVVHASWRAPAARCRFPEGAPSRPTAPTLDVRPARHHRPAAAAGPVLLLARADGPAFHRIEVHRLTRILEIFLTLPAVERGVARQLAATGAEHGYATTRKTR